MNGTYGHKQIPARFCRFDIGEIENFKSYRIKGKKKLRFAIISPKKSSDMLINATLTNRQKNFNYILY